MDTDIPSLGGCDLQQLIHRSGQDHICQGSHIHPVLPIIRHLYGQAFGEALGFIVDGRLEYHGLDEVLLTQVYCNVHRGVLSQIIVGICRPPGMGVLLQGGVHPVGQEGCVEVGRLAVAGGCGHRPVQRQVDTVRGMGLQLFHGLIQGRQGTIHLGLGCAPIGYQGTGGIQSLVEGILSVILVRLHIQCFGGGDGLLQMV